jgi:hypothetical protein
MSASVPASDPCDFARKPEIEIASVARHDDATWPRRVPVHIVRSRLPVDDPAFGLQTSPNAAGIQLDLRHRNGSKYAQNDAHRLPDRQAKSGVAS